MHSWFRGALIALLALAPAGFAQLAQTDAVPLKNWPLPKIGAPAIGERTKDALGGTSPLVFISITPCRVLDTRATGGSGLTGAFGPPSLVGGQARTIPVPLSSCAVPVAAAYSLNLVSITPVGQAVGYVSAWQDNVPWPGTVVLNAPLGGIVGNAAIVPAGPDGGIQVLATNNCDLVIDMNGYYVAASTIQGPVGPQGPIGFPGPQGPASTVPGPAGVAGPIGPVGAGGPIGLTGPAGPTGAASTLAGPAGASGPIGPTGAAGPTGATGTASTVMGPAGPSGPAGLPGANGVLASADYYAVMPPDNSGLIAAGTDISFPLVYSQSGVGISQASSSNFNLGPIGVYLVMFEVSITEPGQIVLSINSVESPATLVGRATGTSQIVGMSIVRTIITNTALEVRNPAAASTGITLTPMAGGTGNVTAHIVILQLASTPPV